MIFENERELQERIEGFTGWKIRRPILILSDTTDFMNIQPGMILRLDGSDFFVRGDATEGRFGIDEQPKYWVKYVNDLETGEKKVLKLVFYEDFTSRVGPFLIRARRSPEKESSVLEVVRGNPHFMQGRTIRDRSGNLVRIIDFVRGQSLYQYLPGLKCNHETYFYRLFPAILSKLIAAFEAIAFLMDQGRQHGDIRSDHLIIAKASGRFVWIDFDFEVSHSDYDLWRLGNLITFAVGKGTHTFHDVLQNPGAYPGVNNRISLAPEDCLLCSKGQIASLGKLYPYIPENIRRLLSNFSGGTHYFYEDIHVLLDHLRDILSVLRSPTCP